MGRKREPDADKCHYCGAAAVFDIEARSGTGIKRYGVCGHHKPKRSTTASAPSFSWTRRALGEWGMWLRRIADRECI